MKQGAQPQAAATPALLFDLDGTLIDSVYEHVRTWHETLRNAGIIFPAWTIHRRIGMSGKSFVREFLRERGPKGRRFALDALDHEHSLRFNRVIPELQPLPGANELLRHLRRTKIRFAIATTGNRKQTERLLKKIKLPP